MKENPRQVIIKKRIIYFILFCFSLTNSKGQSYYDSLSKKVLLLNKEGLRKGYRTDYSNKDSIYIIYLGKVIIKKIVKYKIVTIEKVWGPNRHTIGYIWIYDCHNNYLGKYMLGEALDLPFQLNNNYLLFSNRGKGCEKIFNSKVDFSEGIPKSIQIPVCGGMGDIYNFIK